MPRLRRHALVACVVLALAAAGCGGDESGGGPSAGENVSGGRLKRLALSQADLPSGYEADEQASSTTAPNCGSAGFPPAFLARIKQLGFRGCAGASFRKEVTVPDRRVNRPGSLLLALRSADAASAVLPDLRRGIIDSIKLTGTAKSSAGSATQDIAVAGLGDETLPGLRIPVDLGTAGGSAEEYIYVWRRANVIGYVGSSNFLDDFSERSTLELARRIDARISR